MIQTGNRDIINYDEIIKNENDTNLFNEFKEQLRKVGIDVIVVTAYSRYNSHEITDTNKGNKFAEYYESEKKYFKKIPRLHLYIRTIKAYKKLEINDHISKPKNKEYIKKVRVIWKNIIKPDMISGYYDDDMSIKFLSFPKHYFISKIYNLKEDIKKSIVKLNITQPKEIYCSSNPAFNIIFSDYSDYQAAKLNNDFDLISNKIKEIMTKHINQEYKHLVGKFNFIRFLHPDMKGFNWYGYARQD